VEDKLIKVYYIEPEKKLDKLTEEMSELEQAFETYLVTHEILPLLEELIDVCIVTIGLAIVKHGFKLGEILARFKYKVNRSLMIKSEMEKTGKSYKEIRKKMI
jgi:hypothetical protein